MLEYKEFIENKVRKHENTGFEVDRDILNSGMFEYQKDIVQIALKKGKYAVFADCGLVA